MTTAIEPLQLLTPDAGVIEEARARQRRQRGMAGAVALAAIALAAVLLAFVGGGGGSHPARAPMPAGHPPSKAARLSEASCLARDGRALRGAPSRSLLSILGVLRRPASATDALPQGFVGHGLVRDVFVHYIRRTRVIDGGSYYIFPAIIGGCGVEKAREGMMDLATHISLGAGIVGGAGGGGATAADIEQGKDAGTGPPGSSTRATITMIVPDGVAVVTLRYPAGRASGYSPRISPPVTITSAPVNNELVVSVPRSAGGGPIRRPTVMIWRAADGHVIRTFHRL
jgi:hypothetical protein